MSDAFMRFFRVSHRWLGLALALPLLIQGLTGFILAVTPPFDDLRLPRAATAQGTARGVGAIVAAAKAAAPAGLVPSRYTASPEPGAAATVDLGQAGRRLVEARVFVDPVALTVLGQRDHPDGFYRWVHGLHEFLLIATPFGHGLIGWWGVGLFVLCVTGIPIWWPRHGRWKAAFTVPRAARGYMFWRALHGAAGGCAVLLLIVQSVSGASMAFPRTFGAVLGVPPGAQGSPRIPGGKSAFEVDCDAIAGVARAAVPEADLIGLRFPSEPGRPAVALLLPYGEPDGAPPAQVFVDPSAGAKVILVRDPRAASWGTNVLPWLRALHSGEGLGPVWRAVICVLGLTLPVFPVTGLAMYLTRRRKRRPADRAVLQGASE